MKKHFIFFIFLFYNLLFSAERQFVISKIDVGLANSDNYDFTSLSSQYIAKGLNASSLDLILDFQTNSEKNFTYNSLTKKYSYPYSSLEKYLIFPVTYNSNSTVKSDKIKLLQEEYTSNNDLVTRVLVDETINLPASSITLTNSTSSNSSNLFTYSENQSIIQQHFELYKNQQYMIRISRGTNDYDYDPYNKLNGINLANSDDTTFLNGTKNYIDFYFSGDDYIKLQKITTPNGLMTTFVPGRIEVFGIPQGQYTLTLYSFRYSSEYSDKGNLIVTRESKLIFNSKTIDVSNNLIIKNFDTTNHITINGELILISSTSNPSYTIKEQLGSGTFNIVNPTISTKVPITTAFYYNGTTPIIPNASGFDTITNKYYYKVDFSYNSPNTSKDSVQRTTSFSSQSTTEYISYYVKYDSLPKNTAYPFQTVIAQLSNPQNLGTDSYIINDKVLSPSTFGYRAVKYINSPSIKDVYCGNYTNNLNLTFNSNSYNWTGSNGIQQTILFQKAISDSKGTFTKSGGTNTDIFSFYTIKNIQSFSYEQEGFSEIPENASFLWQDSLKSSYGVLINDDEIIFRIIRVSSASDTGLETKSYTIDGQNYSTLLPKFYLDLYNNINPIGTYNETSNIENFVSGNKSYLDLIFKKGEDRKIDKANALFTFFKDNKFEITGLPRGNYLLQMYTIKGADGDTQKTGFLDYKTLTYETSKRFDIGLPELVYGDFASLNNLFLIESINVNSSFDIDTNQASKIITVNFVTKTSETVNLTKNNLTAQNMEESGGGPYKIDGKFLAERHQNGTLAPVEDANLNLFKADKAPFQFPLDVIFLIDDSGSMQNEIDNVKNSLTDFTSKLEARGYNVKFNLITFGPDQNNRYSGISNNYPVGSWMSSIYQYQDSGYLAIYKQTWFNDVNEVINAFSEMRAIWGYYNNQENGAQAIYNGANLLKTNGRYLDYNNNIVNHSDYKSGYIPSKKLLIFLTDENFDIESLNLIPGISGTNNTQRYNSYRTLISNLIKSEGISLNGIYHIGTGNTDSRGISGVTPADTGDKSYNDFISLLGPQFTRYEMGNNGQLVTNSLEDTVKNIGIIQRWVLSYTSPFPLSDGQKRQAIFSLTGLKNVKGEDYTVYPYIKDSSKDRFYAVQDDKIESYFIKPDPLMKKLIKKDGNVQIQVKARSQYNEIQSDGTTKLINYPIEKGSFKLSGNGNQLVLLSEKNEVSINSTNDGWYTLTSNISAATYYSLFGDFSLDLEATAATKYYGKTTNLTTLTLTELDEPLVTKIKIENKSLKDLLTGLKDTKGEFLFNENEIDNLSSKIYFNPDGFSKDELNLLLNNNSNLLNIKIGDTINYEITVNDESITKLNNTNIILGGVTTIPSKVENTYKGQAILNSNNLAISIKIYDDYGNVTRFKDSTLPSFTMLKIPPLINNSSFENGEYFSNYNTSSNDINTAQIGTLEPNNEAIAYIFRFDYNIKESDYGLFEDDNLILPNPNYPQISGVKNWASSRNGVFNLYDGKYIGSKIYAINKAGAIDGIPANNLSEVLAKLDNVYALDSNRIFYVDTVAPRIISSYVSKIKDSNGIPISGNSLPFKEGDTIAYKYEIQDFNYDKVELNFQDFMASLLFLGETSSLSQTTTVEKNFKVIYSGIEEIKNIPLSTSIYDKAQNKSENINTGVYNSRLPKQIAFIPELVADNIKFTSTNNFQLNSFGTGEEIYYAEVTIGNTGTSIIGSLPIKILSFGVTPIANFYNIGSTISYSLSGQKGTIYEDSIVVDTTINDESLPDIYAKRNNNGIFTGQLSFKTIKELVGLSGFKYYNSSVTIEPLNYDENGFSILTNAGYYKLPTPSNALEIFQISLPNSKPKSITLLLRDRLGNTKELEQKIYYVDSLTIIGKTNNSEKQVTTKVEMSKNIKISGRSE